MRYEGSIANELLAKAKTGEFGEWNFGGPIGVHVEQVQATDHNGLVVSTSTRYVRIGWDIPTQPDPKFGPCDPTRISVTIQGGTAKQLIQKLERKG